MATKEKLRSFSLMTRIMMNEKEKIINDLYIEVMSLMEISINREDFTVKVGSFLSEQASNNWGRLDSLDKNIFLRIIKVLLEERYGQGS